MNLPEEVSNAAEALCEAIRSTAAFQEYRRLADSVLSDEANARLLDRYLSAQTSVQLAGMAGSKPSEEDLQEFEKLSALLFGMPEMSDYLLARLRVQQLVAQAMEKITCAADIRIDI